MDIIFITHRNPWPPHKGTQVRPWHMVRRLHERGHRVHLFGFLDEGDAKASEQALRQICASVHLQPLKSWQAKLRAASSLWPSMNGERAPSPSERYFYDPELHGAIERTMAQHPVRAFGAFSSTMAQYVPASMRQHAVLDMCDVDSAKWDAYKGKRSGLLSLVYRIEAERLQKCEEWCVRTFAATTLATEAEIRLLSQRAKGRLNGTDLSRLFAITNGTDLGFFYPAWKSPGNERQFSGAVPEHLSSECNRIVFTGAMDYAPNIEAVQWFCQACWPDIRSRHPDAQFLIVGSKPAAEVSALAALPGVTVTGFVEDVRPYLTASRLAVVPLRLARGVQNKALEAMACGLAMVATPAVAQGVQALHGEQALVAEEASAFTRFCLDILDDPKLERRLGQQARMFVEKHYAWEPLMDKYVDRLEAVARPPGP